MGFSVSGATVVILAGLLLSMATLYPAVEESQEQQREAIDARDERLLDQRNTAIDITSATYDSVTGTLTVEVENTGTTTLDVERTDLLVDGEYQSSATTDVDGDSGRTVWAPGETLTFTLDGALPVLSTSPDRVKVVTEYGVAASRGVT